MHRNIVCTALVCIRTSIARLQVQPRDKSISRQPVPTRREKIGHQSVDDCDLRVTNLVTMAAFKLRKRICLMCCIPLCDLRQFLTEQILTNVWQSLLKLFPWWLKKCIANLCQRVIYIFCQLRTTFWSRWYVFNSDWEDISQNRKLLLRIRTLLYWTLFN